MKIRKRLITAVLAVFVLCMSFSTMVFAAPSPVPVVGAFEGLTAGGKVSYANQSALNDTVAGMLKDQGIMKGILASAGITVPDGQSVVVLGAGEFTVTDGSPLPATFAFGIKDAASKGVKEGDTVYYMTRSADGTWKTVKAVVTKNDQGELVVEGVLDEKTTSVAIVKVMSNGEVKVYDSNNNEIGKVQGGKVVQTSTSTVKKSPKTGE